MLSKVANRVYWMGRYLERSEDTARMLNAYYQLILDLPTGLGLAWDGLLDITSSSDEFDQRHSRRDERAVVRFMLADRLHPGSIRSSVRMARENLRTTRDVLPASAWECVNELHLFVEEQSERGVARRRRYDFLMDVIGRVQQITGLLDGSLSRDQVYGFYLLGRNIERADMSTRILDVSSGVLLDKRPGASPFDSLLWMNLLKSLSALGMYRWHRGPTIEAEEVLRYLFSDPRFPRSVSYCLSTIKGELGDLPRSDPPTRSVNRVIRRMRRSDYARLADEGLHDYIDKLQKDLIAIDKAIHETWFDPESGG